MRTTSPLPGVRCLTFAHDKYVVDYSAAWPSKREVYALHTQAHNFEPYRQRVLQLNMSAHLGNVTEQTAIRQRPVSGTCVLVAPGPSAACIGERLKGLRDKVEVAVVNRAGRMVSDPDYFVCVDAIADPDWWVGIDSKRTKLLTSPMANFELAEKWTNGNVGYVYLADMGAPDFPGWAPLTAVDAGEVTSTAALAMLKLMGFENVVVVGHDFSWAPEKNVAAARFYADGTPLGHTYMGKIPQAVIPIETARGIVHTTPWMSLAADAMAAFMRVLESSGVKVFNSTESGILDWPYTPLEEAVDDGCRVKQLPG